MADITDTAESIADANARFPLGSKVRDTHQDPDDDAVAYVVGHTGQFDDEYVVEGTGQTVAELNDPVASRHPVVEVVFEDTLRQYVPDWEQHAGEFSLPWHVARHIAEWGVPVQRYAYPTWRIERVDD